RYPSIEGKADVIPGQTVKVNAYMTNGYADWSLHTPTWKYDGTEIAYLFGNDTNPFGMPANNTTPGATGTHLLGPVDDINLPLSSHTLSYRPNQAFSNQLIYSGYNDGTNIYLATVGQDEPGQILLKDRDLDGFSFGGLAWLPDGSGFLYSMGESFGDIANMFRYSFSTKQSYRLTNLNSGWTRNMAVSPDGSQVVFELQTTGSFFEENPPADLYIMNIDGSGQRLLAKNGRSPAWGPTYTRPTVTKKMIYLPFLNRK
ncbi:MAG: TolB family protein, partial [Omnitrophica WOR_2 bacterium]